MKKSATTDIVSVIFAFIAIALSLTGHFKIGLAIALITCLTRLTILSFWNYD